MGGKRRKGGIKTCKACLKEFYVAFYRLETAKFCSVFCLNHTQYKNRDHVCATCKKHFTDSPSRWRKRKYCSIECSHPVKMNDIERRRKQKFLQRVRRNGVIGRTVRKFVFSIKEKKCEVCGYDEYDFCLDIHHKDKNPQNNAIENLGVLCAFCHRKHHKGLLSLD